MDASGNVFLAGHTLGSFEGTNAGYWDGFVRKYDPAGAEAWTRQFGTGGDEYGYGLAVDAGGNVYVGGYTTGDLAGANLGGNDGYVHKYDAQGNGIWIKQFGTASGDYVRGLAMDGSGNIYAGGYTFGDLAGTNAGGSDAIIVKIGLEEEAPTPTSTATPSATASPTPSATATPTATTAAILQGSISLQARGYAPSARWIVPLTITLHAPGVVTPSLQFNPTADPSGRFTVTEVAVDTYDVKVKKAHSLTNMRQSVTLASGLNSLEMGMLLEGDVNDDGIVNALDYAPLAAGYFKGRGQEGFDERVDFNEDGRINSSDYAPLAFNYFRRSDVVQ